MLLRPIVIAEAQNRWAEENCQIVHEISPVGEEIYGEKDLSNSQILSVKWKSVEGREHKRGENEGDELSCVIGSKREGDYTKS